MTGFSGQAKSIVIPSHILCFREYVSVTIYPSQIYRLTIILLSLVRLSFDNIMGVILILCSQNLVSLLWAAALASLLSGTLLISQSELVRVTSGAGPVD
ncbi:hypothetical protein BGW37DRAFT_496822 [Umbelopsis sp. PMI_123]|nr:hypothetical protein BGW37DRAFT_496822 [Umbelopsis sp. PMI_123]